MLLYEFSLPTTADNVPTGSDWLHEVKYLGYRMMFIREQNRVRLVSSGGHDWARYFPLIVEAALKLCRRPFPDRRRGGGARSRRRLRLRRPAFGPAQRPGAALCLRHAAGGGEDHRRLPLSMRKANLDRLLSRHVDGIFMADYEQGEIGHDLFRAACRMGLEGIVSKHRRRAYRGGKCRHWIKVKNRAHPAYTR